MTKFNSKVVLSAIAMAALVATPAFAKARKHSAENVPAHLYNSTAPVNANTVTDPEGRVIGADPSAQIRSDLLRDRHVRGRVLNRRYYGCTIESPGPVPGLSYFRGASPD